MKHAVLPLLLLVCLLVGCGSGEASISSASSETGSAVSMASSAAPADRSEPSSAESSAEEISLLPVGIYGINEELQFHLPEGWTVKEPSSDGELFTATDGVSCTVSVYSALLDNTTGLTERLLTEEMLPVLIGSWEEDGTNKVAGSCTSVTVAGISHPAIALTVTREESAVYQQQLYILYADHFLTLTVTSFGTNETARLWASFEPAEGI